METQKQQVAEAVYKAGAEFFKCIDNAEALGLKVEFSRMWQPFIRVTETQSYKPQMEGTELYKPLLEVAGQHIGVSGVMGIVG